MKFDRGDMKFDQTSSYGIRGNFLIWIKGFLANQTQCVLDCSSFSLHGPVRSGITQGRVLCLLLYTVFKNNITDFFDPDNNIIL